MKELTFRIKQMDIVITRVGTDSFSISVGEEDTLTSDSHMLVGDTLTVQLPMTFMNDLLVTEVDP
jgi:hypothetical protein